MNLHTMVVQGFDAQTGTITVESTSGPKFLSVKAKLLSKMPPGQAGYEQSYPANGTRCLVGQVQHEYFILGYYKTANATTNSYRSTTVDIDPEYSDGYKIEGTQGHHVGLDGRGNVILFASLWSRVKLFKNFKKIWTKFYSGLFEFGGGVLNWVTNNQLTEFMFEVRKREDPYSDAQMPFGQEPNRRTDFPNYSDKFIFRSRYNDAHVVEFETRQAVDANSPNTRTWTRYGKGEDGTHKIEEITDKDGRITNEQKLTNTELNIRTFTNGNTQVKETIHNDGKTELVVNDKAHVIIDADGTITISSQDSNVYIGQPGGTRKGLLTTDFLDLFINHTHMGPTGTDVGPAGYITGVSPSNYMSANIVVNESNKEQTGQFRLADLKIYTSRVKGD